MKFNEISCVSMFFSENVMTNKVLSGFCKRKNSQFFLDTKNSTNRLAIVGHFGT